MDTGFTAMADCWTERIIGVAAAIFIFPMSLTGCDGERNAENNLSDKAIQTPAADATRPNILFISIDDLNDWVEPLGGHPQAKTPNIAAFARRAVSFERAYTASPACNPSRSALLTGKHTYSTGMYSNYQDWREVLKDPEFLPDYFRSNGYWAGGAGKIFHNTQPSPDSWDAYYPSKDKHMPDYYYPNPGATVNMPAFENMYYDFDWAAIDKPIEETGDYKSVSWAINELDKERDKPFFLAVGIYRPHVPWYAPKEFFDMHPLDSIELPKSIPNDLDDVPERGQDIATRSGNYHKHITKAGKWREAVQGYLASTSYADALVGQLLEALRRSEYAENTIVVLLSDHGWQLGEKKHWRKFALWENVARVPLMVYVPKGVSSALPSGTNAARVGRTVSLVDLFPTLVDLAGLPEKQGLDGRSLTLLLQDAAAPWPHPAITTYDFNEFSVRDERYRYIRYIDGSEELYDHEADPEEWRNLADDENYANVKASLIAALPKNPAPLGPVIALEPHHTPPFGSAEQYRAYREALSDEEFEDDGF